MNKAFLHTYLPFILLGGLLFASLITILLQADNYGITLDEPLQDSYGHTVLNWYITLGKDTSFLTQFGPEFHMPEHGGIFDAGVAAVQQWFPAQEHWHVRRIVTALAGFIGLIAVAFCGYELGGGWMAFLAVLTLWLYPRYYGAIYNNSKDIPAAVTMAFVLWAVLLLTKQWGHKKSYLRNSLLVGFFIGLAASIRVTAIVWYAILALICLAWWLLNGKRVRDEGRMRAEMTKQAISAMTLGIASFLSMMILWPYIFLNPVVNLSQSIKVMSQYPWYGYVLFNGVEYLTTQLPRTYVPEWLVIASPPGLIILAALGLVIACTLCIKKRLIDPKIAIVILSFVVPFGGIIGAHSVLYDGIRQFLFLVVPMILISVYGLVQAITYLLQRKRKVMRLAAAALAILTLANYVLVITDMVRLSPFEYTYFSPVIGGLPGAQDNFQTDYWGICNKQASAWLIQNYRHYTSKSTPTVAGRPSQAQISIELPSTFHEDDAHPDFYIGGTRDGDNQAFSSYTIIHVIAAENVPLCVIKVNPAILTSSSFSTRDVAQRPSLPQGFFASPGGEKKSQ